MQKLLLVLALLCAHNASAMQEEITPMTPERLAALACCCQKPRNAYEEKWTEACGSASACCGLFHLMLSPCVPFISSAYGLGCLGFSTIMLLQEVIRSTKNQPPTPGAMDIIPETPR